MDEELKPCPFCTGRGEIVNEVDGGYFVECTDCFARTNSYNNSKEAAIWWNLRDNSNG